MQEKIITIEKLVFGGKGLSRDLEKVTFVPFTIPGEKVRVRIVKEHGDYYEAEAVEILHSAPSRIAPDCRYFGRCGGCQLSHIRYDAQMDFKEQMLAEALQRLRVPIPDIQTFTSQPYEYRHRAQLKYNSKSRTLGFFETATNRVIDINECLCLTPGLNRLLSSLHGTLTATSVAGLTEIECFENDRGETAAYFNAVIPPIVRTEVEKYTRVFGPNDREAAISITFRDHSLPMHPSVFLQNNRPLWQTLMQEVESHFQPFQDATAVELYCGTGFFTIPLSKRFKHVYAAEENASAIALARAHAAANNIQWVCARAEDVAFPSEAAYLIVDPPRAGLTKKVVEKVQHAALKSISYVSCDCASFARDARALSQQFRIDRLAVIDLFPQSYHFEIVARLARN